MASPRYVSVPEVKDYVGLTTTDSDSMVMKAVLAAEEWVDEYTDRTFDTVDSNDDSAKTTRLYSPATPALVFVDDCVAIDSVEERRTLTGSFDTVDSDDWRAEPANAAAEDKPLRRIRRVTGKWANVVDGVRVTAWYGWPQIPDKVVEATMLHAAFLYQRRQAPFGISQVPGLEGSTGMRVRSRGDPTAEALLDGYVRRGQVAGQAFL